MNVAVLGASNKPERYSYKAIEQLLQHGHQPFPVHPSLREVQGLSVFKSIEDIPDPLDTVTVYLSAANSDRLADGLAASTARRVIFNPGAENPKLAARLEAQGKTVVQACTLVMLSTGQF